MNKAVSYFNGGFVVAVFICLIYFSATNYLLFHTAVELFSIAVAGGVFMIAWNTRAWSGNAFFLVLGVAYLFTGLLDLSHTLAYKGMPLFPEYDANLPTTF